MLVCVERFGHMLNFVQNWNPNWLFFSFKNILLPRDEISVAKGGHGMRSLSISHIIQKLLEVSESLVH